MGTAALATGALATTRAKVPPPRSSAVTDARTDVSPAAGDARVAGDARTVGDDRTAVGARTAAGDARTAADAAGDGRAAAAARAVGVPSARGADVVAPPAPYRNPRIAGTTTERMPVRACSGAELGRHVQAGLAGERRPEVRLQRRPVAEIEPPALRLTRRGRMLMTTLSVLVFGSAIAVLGLRVAGVLEPEPQFSRTIPVQVGAGQTLWSIAQETNPSENPAAVVEKIADLNNLRDRSDITPGQTLQIPLR